MVVRTGPENCGNCEFYMAAAKVCRRYPPVPLMLGAKQGLAGQEPAIMAYFPSMTPAGWCGEHQLIPEAENNYVGTN